MPELIKYCPRCNSDKPRSQFGTYYSARTNKHHIQAYCRACANEY